MLEAAKTRPSRTPRTRAPMLNSVGASVAGTYGEKVAPGAACCVGMVMREYEGGRAEDARRPWSVGAGGCGSGGGGGAGAHAGAGGGGGAPPRAPPGSFRAAQRREPPHDDDQPA